MDDNEFLDLINDIYELEGDFTLGKVANLIVCKKRSNITNCMVSWNNQVNDQFEPIIYQENIKGNLSIESYFTKELFKLTEAIGPLTFSNLKLFYKDFCKDDILAIQSICLLPIRNHFNHSKAIIVFLSASNEIEFSKEQITTLHKIINELYNSRSAFLIEQFENLIGGLSDFSFDREKSRSLSEKYDELSNTLELLKDHICHYSIWKIDNLNKENYKIIKEKYQTFNRSELKNGNFILNYDDNHIIADYIQRFIVNHIKHVTNDSFEIQFSQCISGQLYKYKNNPESCFTLDYCKEIGIIEGRTIVLCIPIIPRKNVKYDSVNILCLYINNIESSVFRNSFLLSLISNKIYETFTLHNKIITNQTTEEILNASVASADSDEEVFYRDVIKIFKKKNECDNCFIYFRNNLTDSYELNSYDQYQTKDILIKDFAIPVPSKLYQHENFMIYFQNFLENNISRKSDIENNFYYGTDSIIKAALILPIFNQENRRRELTCFALFINKNIKGKGSEKNSPFFSIHNENIIRPGLEYINKYRQFKDAANNKDTLLKRIRHEIPNEVNLIRQNADIIKDFLSKVNIHLYENRYGNNKHLLNVINQLSLSNMRIELFAGFATTVGFTEPKIMSKMERLNLSVFLSSMIDIFQTDAQAHGVRVRFLDSEKPIVLYVSQLYKLSIINIITNAIRYSCFGTCILIKITEHSISIEDFGIAILPEDNQKIYKENYRGERAKSYNQDGLGYGLFLAKKIIESHKGHRLNHISTLDQETNLYGVAALYNLLNSNTISFNKKLEIFYNQLEDEDLRSISEFNRELNRLYSLLNNNPNRYFQIDIEIAKTWIFDKFFLEKILYNEFVRIYLSESTYRTIFTVNF